jgi:quinol monooxygenase YgiN
MRSPWQAVQELDPGRDYLALVSDIPPLRLSSTGRWFRGAQEVTAQLRDTEGVVGFSLSASPLRKRYLTLSVWTDEEALANFVPTRAHGRMVHELRPQMAPTRFVRWTFPGREGRPSWREGLRRVRAVPATPPTNDHRSNP